MRRSNVRSILYRKNGGKNDWKNDLGNDRRNDRENDPGNELRQKKVKRDPLMETLRRLFVPLKGDLVFQYRQGFYIVYIVLTLFYMLILTQLPHSWLPYAVPIIVFSDPSMVGLVMVGGMVMLEKEQGVIDYFVVTPLGIREYVFSKIISMTILAEVAGLLITVTCFGIHVHFPVLIFGIALSAIMFTLAGLCASIRCRTVNGYFLSLAPYLLFFALPFISFTGIDWTYLLTVIPSYSGFILVYDAFNGVSPFSLLIHSSYMVLIIVLLYRYVHYRFEKYVVYNEGR